MEKKFFALRDCGGDLSAKWFVQYKDPGTGKWVKKYDGINQHQTKEGRVAAANALIKKLAAQIKPPPPNATTKAALYQALEKKKGQLRAKSYQSYLSKLNGLFDWLRGRVVDKPNLLAYFEHCANAQAAGTAHDTYYTIKRILKYIGLEHLAAGWKPPTPAPEPARYFQRHETELLRAYMANHDLQLLLWCMFVYYCFLRPRSELRFLKVADILFEERRIRVPGKVAKNKKTQFVVIPTNFWPYVATLRERPPGAFIFENKKGNRVGYNTLGTRFNKVLEQLGFDATEYEVYSFKHTGAVRYYKATKDLVGLQEQLRHHSLDQVKEYMRCLGVWDFEDVAGGVPDF